MSGDRWVRGDGTTVTFGAFAAPSTDDPYRCAPCRRDPRSRCSACGCYRCGTTTRRHNPADCASPLLCGRCWREQAEFELGEASGRRGLIGARCAQQMREDEQHDHQEVQEMQTPTPVTTGAERAAH